ncbi:MAG TPA: chromosome segregation protein SMC, partial [Bryobacteraceae bacterium]|nr:chromosome segregation protein SMC [Bryobacteraceae bacterium]
MLKLKRIELQGFKSFCDRSEMRFHGNGVAAIVGPNGCGKSNLSDAITWVLGEQSARSLRGSRMEDVIFAGTRERKPVGMASVTMTLVDPAAHSEFPVANGNGLNGNVHADGHRDAKNGEITITRRLYRSGESEYLINGRTARLRDIQDIFMGSGLGPESYAIIEQGRIGQILSTRPADRRGVIEEAAGITRFKTKRRLAEARLESARANLTRVFDILEEVGRHVNSLRRQAAKAKRYSELRTEMIAQLTVALSGRYRLLERDIAKTAIDLNLAATEAQKLVADVESKEAAASGLLESSYGVDAKLTEARKQLAEQRVEAERVRGRLESQAREIGSIESRLTRGEEESQDLEKRFTHGQLELDEYARKIAELEAAAEQIRTKLNARTVEREHALTALRERERSIEGLRNNVLKLLGEASSLRNQLAQIDGQLNGITRDLERIGRDEQSAAAEIERTEAARGELTERLRATREQLQAAVEHRKQVDEELSTRRARAAESRRKLDELRAEVSRIRARRDSLNDVLLHRSYTTETVKRFFTAIEKGHVTDLKPAGVLADFLEVETGWEKAVEEFLHDELEYVVVNSWDEAERGIAYMRGGSDGRATFLVHPQTETHPGQPDALDVEGLTPLRNVVRLSNGLASAPSSLVPRVDRCLLVEDRTQAQKLAPAHPDLFFLLPDGVCYHGHAVSGGKKTGSGPLGLKREMRELGTQLTGKEKELTKTRSLLEDLELEMAQLNEDLERIRGQQNRADKEAVALDHELRKLNEEGSRAQSRLSVARREAERLQAEQVKAQERRATASAQIAEKEQSRAEQEQGLAAARTELEEFGRTAARIGEEHSTLRVQLAGLDERRKSDAAARGRIENQLREMAHRRQNLTRDMERLGVDRARLLSDNVELDVRATALASQITASDAQVAELAAEESRVRVLLAEADEQLRAVRHEVQSASEKKNAVEVDLVRKQAELKYLDETCHKELNCALADLPAADGEAIPDESVLADAEAKYTECRTKIEALGPVNTSAEEEFSEAQTRADFLTAQKTDLITAIKDTEKAIGEIDVESRKRFVEAFEAINENFREIFKTLFSGGVAEMRLTDAENGESGIDIIAQPPGKKLQSVLLLSGGERALTAMALLMGIFRYQPSPFCVLDEVDAPLDEANIERLTRLIREMSAQTQFIVITHAKRTMEAAQALYGVTMQEPGVSKLVSVRFQEMAAPPPPPPPQAELAAAK